jgi:23S rRNA pseudouridine2605 synthase
MSTSPGIWLNPSPLNKVRLQKYLAECGLASRRKSEELITAGKVSVNGAVVIKLGIKIDPVKDKIEINGKPVKAKEPKIYIKLYKPRGVVSSCLRQAGEETILDLVKDVPYRLYPVGRLDKDSEGLMLLTNDGELANHLMHPRYEHEKEYLVNVELRMTNYELMGLQSGILIDGKKTLPAKVKLLDPTTFSITLKEGKKRQIRKMVEAVGNRVVNLKRIRIGKIILGKLLSGKYELFDPESLF